MTRKYRKGDKIWGLRYVIEAQCVNHYTSPVNFALVNSTETLSSISILVPTG